MAHQAVAQQAAAAAAAAAAALAAQQAAAEQSQMELLDTIWRGVQDTFTRLKIQTQLPPAPPAPGITSAILRAHIVNCLDILVKHLYFITYQSIFIEIYYKTIFIY